MRNLIHFTALLTFVSLSLYISKGYAMRNHYTIEQLEATVNDVKKGAKSLRQAAKVVGTSAGTFRIKINKVEAGVSVKDIKDNKGRKTTKN